MAIRYDDILKASGGGTQKTTAINTTVQSQAARQAEKRRQQEEQERERKRQEEQRRQQEKKRQEEQKRQQEKKRKEEEQRKQDQERLKKANETMNQVKARKGLNPDESLSDNIAEAQFGKGSMLAHIANNVTHNSQKNLKEYTPEQEAQAKSLQEGRQRSMERAAKTDPALRMAMNSGLIKQDENDYQDFLAKKSDDTMFGRILNAAMAGGQTWERGRQGTNLALRDAVGADTQDAMDEMQYLSDLSANSMARTPQEMPDRIAMNAVNNALNALQTSAAGALGLPAKAAGLGFMAANSFGNAYGDVRTGEKGEQFANDLGAATRYGLVNAGNELVQEAVDPFGFVPGASTPTLGSFLGEAGQEGVGAILDPYMETVIANDPFTQTDQWLQAMRDTLANQYVDENGNFSGQKALQRAGSVAMQGLEGGIGGVAGGIANNPAGAARQLSADIRSIAGANQAKQAIQQYDQSKADYDTASKNGDVVSNKNVSKSMMDNSLSNLRGYVQDGLRSYNDSYRKVAEQANERIAFHTAEEYGVDRKKIKDMVDISNRLGVGFEFVAPTEAVLDGRDAVYDNGRILINANASNPYTTLFAHEMTHATEGSNEYNSFTRNLDELVRQGIIDDVQGKGVERYAELTENLLTDQRSLSDVASYDDSTLKYLAGQLKNIVTGNRQNRELNKTMRSLNSAIEQAKYQEHGRTEYADKTSADRFAELKALPTETLKEYGLFDKYKKFKTKEAYMHDEDGFIKDVSDVMRSGTYDAERLIDYMNEHGGLSDENITAFSNMMSEELNDPGYKGIKLDQERKVADLKFQYYLLDKYYDEVKGKKKSTKQNQTTETDAKTTENKEASKKKTILDEEDLIDADYYDLEQLAQVKRGTEELKNAMAKNFKLSPEHVGQVISAMENNGGKMSPEMMDNLISQGVDELNTDKKQGLLSRINATYEGYAPKQAAAFKGLNVDTSSLAFVEGPTAEEIEALEDDISNDAFGKETTIDVEEGTVSLEEVQENIRKEMEAEQKATQEENEKFKELKARAGKLAKSAKQLNGKNNLVTSGNGGNSVVIENDVFTNETVNNVLNGYAQSFVTAYKELSVNQTEENLEKAEREYAIYKDIKDNGEDAEYFKQDGFGTVTLTAKDKIRRRPTMDQAEALSEFEKLDEERERLIYGDKGFQTVTDENGNAVEQLVETDEWKNMTREERIEATKAIYREKKEKKARKPRTKKEEQKVEPVIEEPAKAVDTVEEAEEIEEAEEEEVSTEYTDTEFDPEKVAAAEAEALAEEAAKKAEQAKPAEKKPVKEAKKTKKQMEAERRNEVMNFFRGGGDSGMSWNQERRMSDYRNSRAQRNMAEMKITKKDGSGPTDSDIIRMFHRGSEVDYSTFDTMVKGEELAKSDLAKWYMRAGVEQNLANRLAEQGFKGNFALARDQIAEAKNISGKDADAMIKAIRSAYENASSYKEGLERVSKVFDIKQEAEKKAEAIKEETKKTKKTEKLDPVEEAVIETVASQEAKAEFEDKVRQEQAAIKAKNAEELEVSTEYTDDEYDPEAVEAAEAEAKAEEPVRAEEKPVKPEPAKPQKPKKKSKSKTKTEAAKPAKAETVEEVKAEEVKAPAPVTPQKETVEEAVEAKERKNRATDDVSKHKTIQRLQKVPYLNKSLKEIINETMKYKPIVHDNIAKKTASELMKEYGTQGAVELATDAMLKGSATAEQMEYFKQAMGKLNHSLIQYDEQIEPIVKYLGDNEINDNGGFTTKDGQKLEKINVDGHDVTYQEFDDLRTARHEAQQDGDRVMEGITVAATEAGRTLRYMRFMFPGATDRGNKLINSFIRQLERENADILKDKKLTVSDELRNNFINAKDNKSRRDAMDAIEDALARQIPGRVSEKLKQWRMLNMLANPRTHIRNVVSNAMTYGTFRMTDATQEIVERVALKNGWIKEDDLTAQRTVQPIYKDFAKQVEKTTDYLSDVSNDKFGYYGGRMRVGSYDSDYMQWHNKASRMNSKLLEKEDALFIKARATISLAQQLQAQGYTIADEDGVYKAYKGDKEITEEALNKMMSTALQSAEEATYHDFNALANKLNEFKKNHKVLGGALEVVVPFTKTPANILHRSLEYTPASLMLEVATAKKNVESGKMTASQALTKISRGLTGTGMMLLGAALKGIGLLTAPDDDDEKTEYYKSNIYGKQDYALHIGNRYYSLDWAYPSIAPLVMGAEVANSIGSGNFLTGVTIGQLNALSPILEASYLQSVKEIVDDAIQGANYGGELLEPGLPENTDEGVRSAVGAADRVALGVGENLFGQMLFLGTLQGSVNRTIDSTKRTTSGNSTWERMANKALMNTIGGSYALQPAIDQKGEVINYENMGVGLGERALNNFVNPATMTVDTHDESDDKLVALGGNAMPLTQTGKGALKSQIKADLMKNEKSLASLSPSDYTKVKQAYYGAYNKYAKEYLDVEGFDSFNQEYRDDIFSKINRLALTEAKSTYYDKIGANRDSLATDEQKALLSLSNKDVGPADLLLVKNNGLSGNRKALYVYGELEAMGVADKAVKDIRAGKYPASAIGLNEAILKKTALQKQDAVGDYLREDGETLASQAATFRVEGKADTELTAEEQAAKLAEMNDDITSDLATAEFFEKRAISAGLTGKQFYDYQDIQGIKGEDGKWVSNTRALNVMKQMMKDDTWSGYKEAYAKGEVDDKDLSAMHLSKSFLDWDDDAISEAITAMENGEWTGITDFKKAYKKAHGVDVKGKASSGSSSGSKSSSKTTAEQKAFLKAFEKALKSDETSKIKGSIDKDSAALFDRIVNGSKSDIEKLKREIGLK